MKVTIYHNPNCSASRGALAILRERAIEPVVVQYLKTPLDHAGLKTLVAKLGVPAREVVRWKEKDTVAAAGIAPDSPEDVLLEAMARFPVLMNRPIVVTAKGAKICRPSDSVVEIL